MGAQRGPSPHAAAARAAVRRCLCAGPAAVVLGLRTRRIAFCAALVLVLVLTGGPGAEVATAAPPGAAAGATAASAAPSATTAASAPSVSASTVSASSPAAVSASVPWHAVGPVDPGTVVALRADPEDGRTLYLATDRGFLASRNGGADWEMTALAGIRALAVHPAQPRHLLLVTQTQRQRFQLWRSEDRGRSWKPGSEVVRPAGSGLLYAITAATFDARDPRVLWVGGRAWDPEGLTSSSETGAADGPRLPEPPTSPPTPPRDGRLWRSTDGGDSLEELTGPADLPPSDLLSLPSGTLLAATAEGILRSEDRGNRWSPSRGGLEAETRSGFRGVHRLVAFLQAPETLYAIVGPARGPSAPLATGGGAAGGRPDREDVEHSPAVEPGKERQGPAAAAPSAERASVQPSPGATGGDSSAVRLDRHDIDPEEGGDRALRSRAGAVEDRSSLPGDRSATRAEEAGLYRSRDGGRRWAAVTDEVPAGAVLSLALDPRDRRTLFAGLAGGGVEGTRGGAWSPVVPALPDDEEAVDLALLGDTLFAATADGDVYRRGAPWPPCADDATTLCLDDRFRVELEWWSEDGRQGAGQATPLTRNAGWFWIRDREVPELVVRANGGAGAAASASALEAAALLDDPVHFAALTDLGLDLRIFDVVTGAYRVHRRPPGSGEEAAGTLLFPVPTSRPGSDGDLWFAALPEGGCGGESIDLCLAGGRFEAAVDWRDRDGNEGAAVADLLSPAAGWFRFFRPGDPELFVEVLDGRGVNDHWWLSFGALTDVAFTLRVTDRQTGEERRYEVPAGEPLAHTDREAFDSVPRDR